MFRTVLAAAVLLAALPSAAFAACSAEDAMTKVMEVSDVLMPKVQSKPDEASRIMNELGEATSSGTFDDRTCARLDALMVRAKRL